MRLLDLFCGAGGSAVGYHRAGFDEVVGIDIQSQPDYPFEFIQGDAVRPAVDLEAFDAIHASPPCQAFSTLSQRWGKDKSRWPDCIPPTRALLVESGIPYVIENVDGARRALSPSAIRLTGEMFGLRVHRPRLFELGGFWILSPPRATRQKDPIAVYGKPDGRVLWRRSDAKELRAWASIKEGQEALGTPWITDQVQLAEAIPPAYTEFIGQQLLQQLRAA